jgi:hypothetical protein
MSKKIEKKLNVAQLEVDGSVARPSPGEISSDELLWERERMLDEIKSLRDLLYNISVMAKRGA